MLEALDSHFRESARSPTFLMLNAPPPPEVAQQRNGMPGRAPSKLLPGSSLSERSGLDVNLLRPEFEQKSWECSAPKIRAHQAAEPLL